MGQVFGFFARAEDPISGGGDGTADPRYLNLNPPRVNCRRRDWAPAANCPALHAWTWRRRRTVANGPPRHWSRKTTRPAVAAYVTSLDVTAVHRLPSVRPTASPLAILLS
eukprot:scaffold624_cov214-Pinguiococcus_pyrenoidosus.AAC.1